MTQPHILIVDDDATMLRALPEAIHLRMGDIRVDTSGSAQAALERIAETDYDAIVSDVKMPGMDGLTLLARIHELRPDTPTLLITGHGEHDLAVQALRGGAYDFIQKPIDRDYFVASLSRAIEVRALKVRVEEQHRALERHAEELETAVAERTHELREANAAKDTLLRARDMALTEARTANDRLRALQIVTDAALAHLALDTLLPELLRRIRDVLAADTVAILLLSEDGNDLYVRAAIGLEEELGEGVRIPVGKGVAGTIAAGREPMILEDVSAADPVSPVLSKKARSLVGTPLLVEGRMIGVLHCGTTKWRHFTRDDANLLQLAGDRIALAIDHGRLYAETREALREQQEARAQVEKLARELGRQAAELDAVIEAMPDGVYVYDTTARLVRVNDRGAALAGFTPDQMEQPVEELGVRNAPIHLDGSPLALDEYPMFRALQGETFSNERYIIHRPTAGDEVVLQHSGAPIRDASGQITGAVLVAGEVTELYRLERQKDEFLSIASHELKTPLTSLKGLAQITHRRLERAGSDEAAHLVGIERAIERMETLVNDLLDISRIESGKLALRTERADLVEVCRQVVEEQRAATTRPIVLEMPEAPIELEMDPDRIGQVLTNLLSNALKYSPSEEPVALSVQVDDGEAMLRVVDHGPGIPTESLPHVFERFYRVPGVSVQTGSGVGLGLGLYICAEIIERHGGRIWVESVLEQGSVFTVALPLVPTQEVAGGSNNGRYHAARSHATEGLASA